MSPDQRTFVPIPAALRTGSRSRPHQAIPVSLPVATSQQMPPPCAVQFAQARVQQLQQQQVQSTQPSFLAQPTFLAQNAQFAPNFGNQPQIPVQNSLLLQPPCLTASVSVAPVPVSQSAQGAAKWQQCLTRVAAEGPGIVDLAIFPHQVVNLPPGYLTFVPNLPPESFTVRSERATSVHAPSGSKYISNSASVVDFASTSARSCHHSNLCSTPRVSQSVWFYAAASGVSSVDHNDKADAADADINKRTIKEPRSAYQYLRGSKHRDRRDSVHYAATSIEHPYSISYTAECSNASAIGFQSATDSTATAVLHGNSFGCTRWAISISRAC